MATTYEPIATQTLGSNATSITFNSIGSGYTDLRLVLVATAVDNNSNLYFSFNNDSSSIYSYTSLTGNGTTAASSRETDQVEFRTTMVGGISSTIPSMTTLDLFSYAGSTFKTALIEFSADYNGSGTTARYVGLYRSASAITSVKISSIAGVKTGTTATLYGILKA
jgi:hypothetical protein